MKIQSAASILLASALLLPIAGYAAEPAQASPTKTYVKDSVITTTIKAELAKEKLSSLVHISVDTDNKGAVTLGGSAANQVAIDKAISIARGVKGVSSVESFIIVSPAK